MSKRTVDEKKKGIGRAPRHTRLQHALLLETPAFRALSPPARSLLLELAMMENGENNGTALFLSVRDAADRMGVRDPGTAVAAFRELTSLGFLAVAADSFWNVKAADGSRARGWRLTWVPVSGMAGPTRDFDKPTGQLLAMMKERLAAAPSDRSDGKGLSPADVERMVRGAQQRIDAGCRALKRFRRSAADEKNTVGNFPTPTAVRVGKNHMLDHENIGADAGSVRNFPTRHEKSGAKSRNVTVGKFHTHTVIPQAGSHSGDGPEDEKPFDHLRRRARSWVKRSGVGANNTLAAAAGFSASALSNFTSGGRPLNPINLGRLAAALDELELADARSATA